LQFQAQETRTQERTRIDRLKIPEISALILPTLKNTGVMLVMGYSSGLIPTVGIQLTPVADSDEKGILGAVGNKPKEAPPILALGRGS
jgi:hypothetical protein